MTLEEKNKKLYNEYLPVFFEAVQRIDYNDPTEKRIKLNELTLFASNGSVLICEGFGVFKAICNVDSKGVYWFSHAPPVESGKRSAFLFEVIMNIQMLDKKYLV